jgi:hypothetical protein
MGRTPKRVREERERRRAVLFEEKASRLQRLGVIDVRRKGDDGGQSFASLDLVRAALQDRPDVTRGSLFRSRGGRVYSVKRIDGGLVKLRDEATGGSLVRWFLFDSLTSTGSFVPVTPRR